MTGLKEKQNHHSMRVSFAAIFAIVLAAILILIILLNNWGLQVYYQATKVHDIENAYERLNDAVSANSLENMEAILQDCSEKLNISIAVVDSGTNSLIISSERDGELLLQQLRDRLFGERSNEDDRIVKENEYYRITGTNNPDGLTLFGYTKDNNTMILMFTPMENIRENARIANTFLIYISLIATIIGAIAIFFVSGKAVRLSELEAANAKLKSDLDEKERQNAIKQEFIANVSHELKTPIAVIRGYAEGLHDGLCEDEEGRKYYSEIIVDESEKMNRVVQQLIQLNSLESGAEIPVIEPFNISEMLKGIVENERLLIEKKNVSVCLDVPNDVIVLGDEFKIESVITNYLSNAMHHVSEKGCISVHLEKIEENGKRLARCSVFNTGKQIPEDALEHIWEKFYKVDKAHSRQYGGSGIGLSIVKAIMEAHNQKYGAKNQPDGVTMWFDLTLE